MPEIPDLHLHHPSTRNDVDDNGLTKDVVTDDAFDDSERSKWIFLIALSLVAAALLGYVVLRDRRRLRRRSRPRRLSARRLPLWLPA
jgi:hypothetical protein